MGFYIRKSFRMGPVRLNLSKSGLGVSAGVRGARTGVSAAGRSYVHAGRGGLYWRKSLGGRSTNTKRVTGEPIVMYEDTGVTYGDGNLQLANNRLVQSLTLSSATAGPPLAIIVLGIAFVAVVTPVEIGARIGVFAAGLLIASVGGVWLIRRIRRARARQRLARVLDDGISLQKPLNDGQRQAINAALQDPSLPNDDGVYYARRAVLDLLSNIVDDRRVTQQELQILEDAAQLLSVDRDFLAQAKVDVFKATYLEVLADAELSEDEEAALNHIREQLQIFEESLADELRVVSRLSQIRRIREGELPTITPSKPLQKSELCHYETKGRMLKEKNLRSFQSDGQKYRIRGLVVDKEGTLYVTNKRLLLVHTGTSSIRYDKIIDLEVDYDQSLLRIVKDGSQTPVLVTVPDAMTAGAILAAAVGL
jgi:hypothetical protein